MDTYTPSKFHYIKYPFFGLYSEPEVEISFDTIKLIRPKSVALISEGKYQNYLEELLELESSGKTRIKFQITANSTQELIMLKQRCVWGIDSTGRIHNLKRKEKFPSICVRPRKITNNKLIWFHKVTRPIETPLNIVNIKDDILYYWFKFIYIDRVWELFRVSPDYLGETEQEL